MPAPAGVFWNAEISCDIGTFGVEYATSERVVSFARFGAAALVPAAMPARVSAATTAAMVRLVRCMLLEPSGVGVSWAVLRPRSTVTAYGAHFKRLFRSG